MIAWTKDELNKIGTAEELQLSSFRRDSTLRNPVIMWVVRLGDDLYVRSVNGRTSAWFRGVLTQHAGRIQAGGVEKEVTFVEEIDPAVIEQVGEAYLVKCRRYPQFVAPLLTPTARAATIKLVPRQAEAF